MKSLFYRFSLAGLGLVFSVLVQAGGVHYQIDIANQFKANDSGELSAVEMTWTYDPEVSSFILDGDDLSPAMRLATLQKRSEDILRDLVALNYYAEPKLDGKSLGWGKYTNLGMDYTNKQLKLKFSVALQSPVTVAGHEFSLRMADQDGSANLNYPNLEQVKVDATLAKSCKKITLSKETVKLPEDHTSVFQTLTLDCRH
ncbi:DUF1007 family protein [Thiolinea disciformis]|uniref:DUF1007 family protein n=1 Tax=Thiolinea disciformis TaxID=125614 RepID=UPI00037FB6A2|nr:DUF1007 family protein [Thiolinea disciformis]